MLTVQRRTKTMLVVGSKHDPQMYRFRTNGGDQVGKSSLYNIPYLLRPTDAILRQVARQEIERQARGLGLRLSRNVIIPPLHESGNVTELDNALGLLRVAMDAVDKAWATLRGDKQ
jgi:hypothetical protein